jgi:peptide chain release factor 2
MEAERLNAIESSLLDLRNRAGELRGIFDYDAKAARLTEVNKELEDPNVWNDRRTPRRSAARRSCSKASSRR